MLSLRILNCQVLLDPGSFENVHEFLQAFRVLNIRVNNDLGGLSHRLSLSHGIFDKLIKF